MKEDSEPLNLFSKIKHQRDEFKKFVGYHEKMLFIYFPPYLLKITLS